MPYTNHLSKHNTWLWGFGVLAILHLFAVGVEIEWLILLTKPLLITCLATWFYFSSKYVAQTYSKTFFAGLCLSILGDVLLMFVKTHGELFFMLGLGSFLIAHLFYILAFRTFPSFNAGAISVRKMNALPFVAVFFGAVWLLWKDLGSLRTPVTTYSLVIITMSAFSFNLKNRVQSRVFYLLFSGAILFVASDFVIALTKFKYSGVSQSAAGLVIMTTYLLGQFLLTRGMVKAINGL